MKLTDISVRALKSPAKGATIYYDGTLPGFGVRVSQAGTKSYILTLGERRQRQTIGRVGILSLSEARQEAKRRRAETVTLRQHLTRRWSEGTLKGPEPPGQRLEPALMSDAKAPPLEAGVRSNWTHPES